MSNSDNIEMLSKQISYNNTTIKLVSEDGIITFPDNVNESVPITFEIYGKTVRNNDSTISNVQINKTIHGNTEQEFGETIELNSDALGNFDVLYSTGALERNVGMLTLDGSESWSGPTLASTNTNVFSIRLSEMDTVSNTIISNLFPTVDKDVLYATTYDNEGISNNAENIVRVRVNRSTASSLAAFKTWLASNPLTIYFKIAEATTEEYEIDDIYPIQSGTLKTDSSIADIYCHAALANIVVNATNLISNGDFRDGTKGWGKATLSTFTCSDGVSEVVASAKNGGITQYDLVTAGSVYYLSAKVKADSSSVAIGLGSTYRYHSGSGEFEYLSLVHTAIANHGQFIYDMRTSDWTSILATNFLLINLTEIFGEGNEPTQASMDCLLESFPNRYFEGTTNIFHAKPVLKTLFGDTGSYDDINTKLLLEPSYIRPMLQDVAARVNSLQTENTYTFGFITDTHYTDKTIRYSGTIAEASKYMPLDFIAHGGDFIDGMEVKENDLARVVRAMSYYSEAKCPFFVCNGNHDDNNFYARDNGNLAKLYISPGELYYRTTKFSENDIVIGSKTGQYYYHDNEVAKIRTIFVNTNDIPWIVNANGTLQYNYNSRTGYSNNQLNWIADVALDFSDKDAPTDWAVIVMGHMAGIAEITNFDQLYQIINAYQKGTAYSFNGTDAYSDLVSIDADFTAQGSGEFISFIMGDVHYDEIADYKGLNIIKTLTASLAKDSDRAPAKNYGTETETAWDIFTFDRVEKPHGVSV